MADEVELPPHVITQRHLDAITDEVGRNLVSRYGEGVGFVIAMVGPPDPEYQAFSLTSNAGGLSGVLGLFSRALEHMAAWEARARVVLPGEAN